jgi:hypothetical protein
MGACVLRMGLSLLSCSKETVYQKEQTQGRRQEFQKKRDDRFRLTHRFHLLSDKIKTTLL